MSERHALQADLERYQATGDFAAQAETLMQLAQIAEIESEYSIAQGLYGQAWAAYERMGDTAGMAQAAKHLGETLHKIFWSDDDFFPEFSPQDIEVMYDLALALYKEIDDKYGQADIYMMRGQNTENRDEDRQAAVKQAISCYESLGDAKRQADALMFYVGIDYLPNDEYASVVGQALPLYQKINDIQGEARSYHRLGLHAWWEQRYEDAQALLEMAQTRFILVNDEQWLAWTYMRLFGLVAATQDYQTYLQHSQIVVQQLKSLTLSIKENQWRYLWSDILDQALKHSDFTTARLMYQRQISLYVHLEDTHSYCLLYWTWGEMEYYEAGRRKMGLAICQYALTLMQRYNHLHTNHYQHKIQDLLNPPQ